MPKERREPSRDLPERFVGDECLVEGGNARLSGADLDVLRPVLERLVALLHPEEVWLFGSRAENRARSNSDYDLLAVMPDGASDEELDPIRAWSLARGLGVPIDVVPCTRSEFEEEKHEIDTLARGLRPGGRLDERAA